MKVLVIDFNCQTIICCICGNVDLNKWAVPISAETALICPNDYQGNWGCKPVCRECWEKHDAGQFIGHDPAF